MQQCSQRTVVEPNCPVPSIETSSWPSKMPKSLSAPPRWTERCTARNAGRSAAGSTGSRIRRIWVSHGTSSIAKSVRRLPRRVSSFGSLAARSNFSIDECLNWNIAWAASSVSGSENRVLAARRLSGMDSNAVRIERISPGADSDWRSCGAGGGHGRGRKRNRKGADRVRCEKLAEGGASSR